MHAFVLASSSLPHQPSTTAGYAWSLLGGVAFVWLLFSGGKRAASRPSGQTSSRSSGGGRSGNAWLWILGGLMLLGAVKSQNGSDTSPPAPHSTTRVSTPHKPAPAPKKSTPSGSSCSLICLHKN
jgi:hypothetical protein